jgi:DNA-binding MarR family transcriptional regulator
MRKHNFHSYKRVRQAMALHNKLSEDGLGIYEQQVLIFLGSMMAHETKNRLTIINTCFPTVNEIAKACFAKPTRTNQALDALETKGYITREDFKKGGRDRIRYALVEAVWDAAWTPTVKAAAATGEVVPPAPVISAADRAADKTFLAELDSKPATKPATKPAQKDSEPSPIDGKYDQTEAIIALLRKHFPDHPTFEHPDANRMLTSNVRACIDVAGSKYSAFYVFQSKFDDDEARIAAAKSLLLGGYIRSEFKKWFAEYKADWDACIQAGIDELCEKDLPEYRFIFGRRRLRDVKPIGNWLREHLGSHLLELVEDDGTAAGTEDSAQVMMFRVSEEYKATRRAALALQSDDHDGADDDAADVDAEEEETEPITSDDDYDGADDDAEYRKKIEADKDRQYAEYRKKIEAEERMGRAA